MALLRVRGPKVEFTFRERKRRFAVRIARYVLNALPDSVVDGLQIRFAADAWCAIKRSEDAELDTQDSEEQQIGWTVERWTDSEGEHRFCADRKCAIEAFLEMCMRPGQHWAEDEAT